MACNACSPVRLPIYTPPSQQLTIPSSQRTQPDLYRLPIACLLQPAVGKSYPPLSSDAVSDLFPQTGLVVIAPCVPVSLAL